MQMSFSLGGIQDSGTINATSRKTPQALPVRRRWIWKPLGDLNEAAGAAAGAHLGSS
jgi:hypothetical protein